jgi:hypothetical protein
MDSFPSTFNSKNMTVLLHPLPNLDLILAKLRDEIVKEVEKQRNTYAMDAYFYITYAGEIKSAQSIETLRRVSQMDYDHRPVNGIQLRIYSMILKTIGNELHQAFGNNFTTVHETHWDSECYQFYPITERDCSGMCRIHFT